MSDNPSNPSFQPIPSFQSAPGIPGAPGAPGTPPAPGSPGSPGAPGASTPPPLMGSAPPVLSASPPPPPPPPRPPVYNKSNGGFFSNALSMCKLLGAAVVLIALGFYGALFSMAAQSGPSVHTYRAAAADSEALRSVAILPIKDVITSDTAHFVQQAVQSIIDNKLDIGAVVLRIDSPGGSATASDEMLHEIKRLRAEAGLPIIASYGGYAASGGYYVSCDADRIFAQPTTITGSIGVIAPYMTFERLLDKIGVTPETMTSTAAVNKDTGDPFRAWTDKDRTEIRVMLDAIQDQFVKVVTAGREGNMKPQQVLDIATGMPLMANDALQAGLVDEIGYIDAAIAYAVSKGNFADANPRVEIYSPRKSLTDGLMGVSANNIPISALNLNAKTVRQWMTELAVPQPMMLFMP